MYEAGQFKKQKLIVNLLEEIVLDILFAHATCRIATVNSALNLKSYVSRPFVTRLRISYDFVSLLQVFISTGYHLCGLYMYYLQHCGEQVFSFIKFNAVYITVK